MTLVKFAAICRVCGERGEEYVWPYICRECEAHVCRECVEPGTEDQEGGTRAVCRPCVRWMERQEDVERLTLARERAMAEESADRADEARDELA